MDINQLGQELKKDINAVKDAINYSWKSNRDIFFDLILKKDPESALDEAEILRASIVLLRDKLYDFNMDSILAGRLLRRLYE